MKNNLVVCEMIEKNKELLFLLDRCVYFFRKLNYDKALRLFGQLNKKLEEILTVFLTSFHEWENYGIKLNIEEITGMLQTLLQVQEQGDYVLLADLLEQQLKPWLFFLQEQAGNTEIIEGFKKLRNDCFQKNLQVIKKLGEKNPETAALSKILERGMPEESEKGCQLEYTASGAWTCAVEKRDKRWYLHSNVSPLMEGFLLAEEWLEEEKSEYAIFGLGLGYAVLALYQKSEYINIAVYESNPSILRMAMTVTDFSNMLESGRATINYQPLEEKLPEQLLSFLSSYTKKLIIFEPAIRGLGSESAKKWMENYFIQASSIENQRLLLDGNFRKNCARKDPSIDLLASKWKGRDLYIIAAGPSLDKNYLSLKGLREKEEKYPAEKKSMILATGTVFKKLLASGIRPDYVLVTDANRRVVFQIAGAEQETIPMLYLSTAYYGFAEKYAGEKYIIYQEGFPKAEEYAKKRKIPLIKTGGSVSTTALDLGLAMRCARIIFLGLDLSYPEGFAHAQGTSRRKISDTKGLRMVEDINGNLVPTSRSMDMYREWMEERIRLETTIPILDATEGGVKIEGMKVTTMQQLLS